MNIIEKLYQLGPSIVNISLPHHLLVSADTILPYIPKYFKSFHISSAVATVFLGYVTYLAIIKYYKPNLPREWHNIPLLSSWQYTKDVLSFKLSNPERYKKYTKPILDEHGILRARVLGVQSVVVSNPEYVGEVIARPKDFPKFESNTLTPLGFKFTGYSVAFSNGDIWRRHRKIVSPAFHRSWDPTVFGECAITMFEQILKRGDNGNKSIEITSLSQSVTLDALGKAAFGINFDTLSNPDNAHMNAHNKVFKAVAVPIYNFLPFLDGRWGSRAEAYMALDELDEFFYELIKKKKAQLEAEGIPDKNKADLLTLMIQATDGDEDNPNRFTERELRDNTMTFFLAGHDTTAAALAAAIYYLAKHPEIQEKARKEALSVLGDQSIDYIPTIEETQNLSYISMVIKETLRLSPSVYELARRVTVHDTTLGPYFIPAKTAVSVSVYGLHHNPKFWGPDVEEFKPERWEDETLEKRNAHIYIPFSYGSRSCIGMNFSLIEQRVVLSMLLCKFVWSLPADSWQKDELHYYPALVLRPDKLDVIFKSRY